MSADDRESTPSPLLDVGGLAQYLNVTESYVRRLIQERRVPFIKVGKFIRFRLADIDTWIREQSVDQLTGS